MQYIGLTRWDKPARTLPCPALQGGWFALPDPRERAVPTPLRTAPMDSAPHPLAGLAYDGIAAIGALVRQGRRDALTRAALTQGRFPGRNGVSSACARTAPTSAALAVAQIRDRQVEVIDPAPQGFGGAGF